MSEQLNETIIPLAASAPIQMRDRQAPLRERYAEEPIAAMVTDGAKSTTKFAGPTDPLRGGVTFHDAAHTALPVALHEGVGGDSALPVPGDILCAAIASCLDSTIRVIANMIGVTLTELEVSVEGDVDLRGTLQMTPDTPVAFQEFRIDVQMDTQTPLPQAHIDAILAAAERSCVVLQTLRNPPRTTLSLNQAC